MKNQWNGKDPKEWNQKGSQFNIALLPVLQRVNYLLIWFGVSLNFWGFFALFCCLLRRSWSSLYHGVKHGTEVNVLCFFLGKREELTSTILKVVWQWAWVAWTHMCARVFQLCLYWLWYKAKAWLMKPRTLSKINKNRIFSLWTCFIWTFLFFSWSSGWVILLSSNTSFPTQKILYMMLIFN